MLKIVTCNVMDFMKSICSIPFLCILSLSCLAIIACSSDLYTDSIDNQVMEPSPINVPSVASPSTPFLQPTHTPAHSQVDPSKWVPFPTITNSEEEAMAALLTSKSCELPCYMNITPGKTFREVAESILDSIGAQHRFDWDYTDESLNGHGFQIWTGDDSLISSTRVPWAAPGDEEIYQQFNITIENEMVQRIYVYVRTTRFKVKFQRYWSKYNLQEIFKNLGIPDMAVASVSENGYNIIVVYEGAGIVVESAGSRGSLICPLSHHDVVGLTLTNPSSSLDIFFFTPPRPTDSRYWTSIENVFGFNEKDFYDRILSEPEPCFVPLINYP